MVMFMNHVQYCHFLSQKHCSCHSNSDSPRTILGCHSLPQHQHIPLQSIPGCDIVTIDSPRTLECHSNYDSPGLTWDIMPQAQHTLWQSIPGLAVPGLSLDVIVCLNSCATPWQSIPGCRSNSDSPRIILGCHSNPGNPGLFLDVIVYLSPSIVLGSVSQDVIVPGLSELL